MKRQRFKFTSSVLIAAAVGGIIWVSAGDLNPPAGPVTPTMKTLTEVEPRIAINATNTPGDATSIFKITRPGSYYLTGNVAGAVNAHGLTIDADDVTVDLSGYALIGAGGTTGDGIFMDGRSNVEIHHGTVRNFGSHGISAITSSQRNHRVINVRAIRNVGQGIILSGKGHLVKDCTAEGNGGSGINVGGSGNTVTGNTSLGNQHFGILVGIYSTVTGNTVVENAFSGILASTGSTVTGNTASLNQTEGILLGGNCLVDQNTALNNNQAEAGYANISACPTCTFGVNHAP